MDPASLAAALVAATAGQFQTAMANKMLAIDIDSGRSAVKLIDAAQQSLDSLANVSAGVGGNVNVSV